MILLFDIYYLRGSTFDACKESVQNCAGISAYKWIESNGYNKWKFEREKLLKNPERIYSTGNIFVRWLIIPLVNRPTDWCIAIESVISFVYCLAFQSSTSFYLDKRFTMRDDVDRRPALLSSLCCQHQIISRSWKFWKALFANGVDLTTKFIEKHKILMDWTGSLFQFQQNHVVLLAISLVLKESETSVTFFGRGILQIDLNDVLTTTMSLRFPTPWIYHMNSSRRSKYHLGWCGSKT